jgi:hypothetical protein
MASRQEQVDHLDQLDQLDQWFLTPQGKAVGHAFMQHLGELHPLLPYFKGQRLLQIGAAGAHPWLKYFNYQERYLLAMQTPHLDQPGFLKVFGHTHALPLASESMDCVIAPLSLDACEDAMMALNELDRILKPMGFLVIYGLNRWSLWSLAMRFGLGVNIPRGTIHPCSLLRLKNTLIHFEYLIHHLGLFYYLPPVHSSKWINRLEIFNELGKMISPCPSGFYCMVVQKHVSLPISWEPAPLYPAMAASISN